MKTMFLRRNALICFFFLGLTTSIFAQGSLTPPGAPAPTMKTLDQIKAGIPIDPSKAGFTTPYTINAAGNYYLTGNIAVTTGNAIVIATNEVTLNLGGFSISSTASPIGGSGILVNNNLSDITIVNGFIKGSVTKTNTGTGFSFAINASAAGPSSEATNMRVAGVSVFGCSNGISLFGVPTLIESCQVNTVGDSGMGAQVIRGSSAVNCGGNAINGVDVSDCFGSSASSGIAISGDNVLNCDGTSVSGTGILATNAQNSRGSSGNSIGLSVMSTATNCRATSISTGAGSTLTNCTASGHAVGIALADRSLAQNCNASNNLGDGITVTTQCSVLNCVVCGNGGDGIHLVSSGPTNNRIDGNNASNNTGIGIHQTGGPDFIVRNFARNNVSGTNYSPSSGTSVGPTGSTPNTATSPWANFQ